jgi:hypothetical protein
MMESKKTKWEGLWKNEKGLFVSKVFKKSDIPSYSRLILMPNSYHKKRDNRPEFVFCFASGDAAASFVALEEDDRFVSDDITNYYCFSHETLQHLINKIAVEVGGSGEYGEHIVSDFVDGCGLETEVW